VNADLVLVTRALDFAARRHAAQRRKGLAAEPYINHLAEVALLLAQATGGEDPALVAAGLLHDTLEDTPTSEQELEREFGGEILALVREVTDDKSLPKEVRKRLQVERAGDKSARARLIKIADKTCNLRSIVASPPLGWTRHRRLEYFRWALEVVDRCRGASSFLENAFDEAYRAGMAALGGGEGR